MREILISCILLLMWGLEINGDTYEVLTIPYEDLFPNRHQQNGHNYQKPGYHNQKPGYHQYPRPGYPQTHRPGYQPNYPNYQQPGAGLSNTDWVCRNPSTGDMLIISSDNLPLGNNQNPNIQPNQPVQPNYLNQPTTPNWNPSNPFLPNVNPQTTSTSTPAPSPTPINCNNYPQHPMCGETIILGTTPRTPEATPNSNGEGFIDIRMRGRYPTSNNDVEDRLVFKD